jgi:hypothetical protein
VGAFAFIAMRCNKYAEGSSALFAIATKQTFGANPACVKLDIRHELH